MRTSKFFSSSTMSSVKADKSQLVNNPQSCNRKQSVQNLRRKKKCYSCEEELTSSTVETADRIASDAMSVAFCTISSAATGSFLSALSKMGRTRTECTQDLFSLPPELGMSMPYVCRLVLNQGCNPRQALQRIDTTSDTDGGRDTNMSFSCAHS